MAVTDRLQRWVRRANERAQRFMPPEELVIIEERQHAAVLILPTIRTGAGVGMMISKPTVGLVLLFGVAVLAPSIRAPSRLTRLWVALLVIGLSLAMFVIGHAAGPAVRAVTVLVLLGWLLIDVLNWFFDRLVVSNRRLYRVYGVVTSHYPSVALQQIYFVDVALGPCKRWFGTLSFDTPAQDDAPVHRFSYVPRAQDIYVTVLQLRSEALANNPPPII
jgi:hypothetical protein